MAKQFVLNVDLAGVFKTSDRKGFMNMAAWGDVLRVKKITSKHIEIETVQFDVQNDGSILPVKTQGFICPTKMKPADVVIPAAQNRVLKVNFVDVQQGDGSVIETPSGQVILVDGGDNQLFARYLAGRFRGTSASKPRTIDCMLVTHGDADHFVGLPKIFESETNSEPRKRLFIKVKRVYRNGLVKRPSKKPDGKAFPQKELLGKTKVVNGETIITELEDDLLKVPDKKMKSLFGNGRRPLKHGTSGKRLNSAAWLSAMTTPSISSPTTTWRSRCSDRF
jgi:hypothetical protein